MVTTNIRQYSDEEIISLIDGVDGGDIPTNLDDLKKLLAEVTNRKLDARYVNTLTALINNEITGKTGVAQADFGAPRRPVTEKAEIKQKPKKPEDFLNEAEVEWFPILSFLQGLFKFVAWFMLVICIAAGCIIGFVYLSDELIFIAASIFGGIAVGTIFVLLFYAMAERILLSLEIERHLRIIAKDKE